MPNKVTKNDLVDAIYQKTKCEKQVIQSVVDSFLMEVKSSLEEGSTIELRGFGTFESVLRKEKKSARNPKTGKVFTVPAHYVAKFKPGKELKESLLKKEFNIKND